MQWDDEQEDEDDDLDIVEKAMYGSGDEDEEEDVDPASIRYEDFYVDEEPTPMHKLGKLGQSQSKNQPRRKAVDIDESSDEEDEDEDDFAEGEDDYVDSEEDEDEDDYGRPTSRQTTQRGHKTAAASSKEKPAEFMTSYQRRLQELSTQIKELEEELIAEKSWEMRGEVSAQHRPENSLLDMAVDVDRATKVAPVITQEYTSTLEDLIIQRIQDEKFDDPRPRHATAEVLTAEAGDDKDPIELSQEKSKLGLAEIYAEDYAKKMLNSDEKLSVETQALREEVVGLFGAVSDVRSVCAGAGGGLTRCMCLCVTLCVLLGADDRSRGIWTRCVTSTLRRDRWRARRAPRCWRRNAPCRRWSWKTWHLSRSRRTRRSRRPRSCWRRRRGRASCCCRRRSSVATTARSVAA